MKSRAEVKASGANESEILDNLHAQMKSLTEAGWSILEANYEPTLYTVAGRAEGWTACFVVEWE
jgi:hypothetical protein